MKKPKLLLLAALILLCCIKVNVKAQETEKIKGMVASDFYLYGSMLWMNTYDLGLNDFRKLAPKSALLNKNLTDFSRTSGGNMNTGATTSILLGFKFRNSDKTGYRLNPQLRIGVSYLSGMTTTCGYNITHKNPYDTLISSQTGNVYYVDSVNEEYYNMTYTTNHLRLDGSVIFRTNFKTRASLYAGLGFTAGVSLKSQTEISYWTNTYSSINGNQYDKLYNYFPSDYNIQNESFTNDLSYGFSAYIPMGLDIQLGKKSEFWKRIHLFYETRPCINFIIIPEIPVKTQAAVNHGFGLRISVGE